jgi:hypothetical protein
MEKWLSGAVSVFSCGCDRVSGKKNKLRNCCKKVFRTVPLLVLFFTGCNNAQPEYVFFKTETRDQLEERAIKYCHGDFKVLQEEEFGPYTRARLKCMP